LRHHADGATGRPRIAVDVDAPDLDLAPAFDRQTGKDIDQGRLAGAIGAKKAEELAPAHGEADLAQRRLGRHPAAGCINLGQRFDLDRLVGQGLVDRDRGLPAAKDHRCASATPRLVETTVSIGIIRPSRRSTPGERSRFP
jgi:hypothetical protein